MVKKNTVGYPHTDIKGHYGYLELKRSPGTPSKLADFITGSMSVYMWFPCSNKTEFGSSPMSARIPSGCIYPIPNKKSIYDYTYYAAKSPDMRPLKDDVILIPEYSVAKRAIISLEEEFKYIYTLRLTDPQTLEDALVLDPLNDKTVLACLSIFRAKDVLPPDYKTEDCLVTALGTERGFNHIAVFSDVKNLMDVDGEAFRSDFNKLNQILKYYANFFSAAKKVKKQIEDGTLSKPKLKKPKKNEYYSYYAGSATTATYNITYDSANSVTWTPLSNG